MSVEGDRGNKQGPNPPDHGEVNIKMVNMFSVSATMGAVPGMCHE